MKRDALVEGQFRYWLSRDWAKGGPLEPAPYVLWLMLNPSTAGHEKDDPTIRKCVGFTTRMGFSRLVVVNLFAFRSAVPGILQVESSMGRDIVGRRNDEFTKGLAAKAAVIVCAWGAYDGLGHLMHRRIEQVKELIHVTPKALALGYSKAGQPRHPLMMPYYATGELQAWPRRST